VLDVQSEQTLASISLVRFLSSMAVVARDHENVLPAQSGDAHKVSIDLGPVKFAVAVPICLVDEGERGSIALAKSDRFGKGEHAVTVGVASPKRDALVLVAPDPFLIGDPTVRVCVGSGEDDKDEILSCLFTREFAVVVGVGQGEVVMRECDRPRRPKSAGIPGATGQTPKRGGQNRHQADLGPRLDAVAEPYLIQESSSHGATCRQQKRAHAEFLILVLFVPFKSTAPRPVLKRNSCRVSWAIERVCLSQALLCVRLVEALGSADSS